MTQVLRAAHTAELCRIEVESATAQFRTQTMQFVAFARSQATATQTNTHKASGGARLFCNICAADPRMWRCCDVAMWRCGDVVMW